MLKHPMKFFQSYWIIYLKHSTSPLNSRKRQKGHFPTRKSFSALPPVEKRLLLLFIKKKEFWKKAEGHINRDMDHGKGRRLINCDSKDGGSFIYENYVHNPDYWEETVTEGNPVKVHLSEFDEMWEEQGGPDFWGIKAKACHDFRRLINIEKSISRLKKAISRLKNDISESKYSEIEKLARVYKTTFFASKYVRQRQRNLRIILNELRKGKKLSEINGVKSLVGFYNRFCKSQLRISSTDGFDNELVALRESQFHTSENKIDLFPYEEFNSLFPTGEKHYTVYPRIGKVEITLGWLKPFRIAIIFCAVEFLRNLDSRKLKKCPYCEKYFPAKRINRDWCYKTECRKEHGRLKKQKQREENPAKYY